MSRKILLRSILIFSLALTSFFYTPQLLIAQNSSSGRIRFTPPPPPERGEPTGRSQGGASRGCESTALVPLTQTKNGELFWGLTVAQHPTFWFHIPRRLTKNDAIELTLLDESEKEVYKTKFIAPNTPKGIISLSVPSKQPPLEIGKIYTWSFSIFCDYKNVEDKPGTVKGKIQRVALSPALQTQLASAKSPLEQASIYAQNSLWFDTMTTLGTSIRTSGKKHTSLTTAWNDLLKQANLKNSISEPITPCCKVP
ncbi:MAG: DUF928 domain-containing protein [Calothrix sp. SM1_7_51]|nr:DUF928 domain-containing protein [Calothrix sp. SM1_7_51]